MTSHVPVKVTGNVCWGFGWAPAKRPPGESEHLTCIIGSSNAPRAELVNPRDQSSWVTLLRAAEIHDFQPILRLSAADEKIPDIFYHRECRGAFTYKKTLISLQGKIANTYQESLSEKQWATRRQPTSSNSGVYEKICIFFTKKVTGTLKNHAPENPLFKLVNFEQMKKWEPWPLLRWTTKY